jgi:XTP/dITP diphosphohydrolase
MAEDPRTLVLASANPGKLRELLDMLRRRGWSARPQSDWQIDSPAEEGETFIENALIKARHAVRLSGLPALGEDSGLVVDALEGAPGIFSARYAGRPGDDAANNAKLLAALAGVPRERRTAHFHCAMALLRDASDPAPRIALGTWRGTILEAPRGSGGFGYDPLFWVPAENCTAAELPAEIKNRISHRAQALAMLADQLAAEFHG